MSIQPQANGEALAAFIAGDIDGAWVPEPWATRFIQEGGAHVLVDEADLWPDGEYVTTHLIVRTAFLEEHPDVVKGIIEGLAAAIDLIESDPDEAKSLTNEGIEAVTDQALRQEVHRRRVGEPHLHARPDRLVAGAVGQGRRGRRPPRAGRPRRDLRPHAAQRGPRRPRRCRGRGPLMSASTPAVPPMPLAALRVHALSKVYGQGPAAVHALDGITLEVQAGELLCLVGASGCGKSTLLNLIAGLDEPIGGHDRPPRPRGPHVPGGRALPLAHGPEEHRRWRCAFVACRGRTGPKEADQLLRTVHLDGFGDKRPHELSGGMRQRVAIARAFAQEADILLMDEPFGALDAMTRDLLHAELERLWADRNLSVVFVTHNVREAARLADRVVLLSSRPGRVVHEFTVDIERPRRMDSPEVSSLAAEITDELRTEVRRHAHV